MRKATFGAIAASTALVLSACGSDKKADTPAASDAPAATTAAAGATGAPAADGDCSGELICIGVVTDVGKVDDKSFNQSAWEGAQAGATAVKGKAEYIETSDPKDYAANIGQFIDQKYDIIVTVGFGLGEATAAAATANTGTTFIGVDQFQGEPLPNVTGLVFAEDQAGFMAGALAGYLSKGTVASVLGTDKVPPVVLFGKGFEAGVKYAKADASVSTTYHPGGLDKAFSDPEWGAQTAKQALDNGADVIFGAGGKTGNGALIEVAKAEGKFCIGVDTDQWNTVPEAHPCLITSAMKLIDSGVADLIGQAAGKTIKGGNFVGKVGLAPYHDFESVIPADVQEKVAAVVAGITDGSIKTGVTL
jgi:basic membrane protein A and related proteins